MAELKILPVGYHNITSTYPPARIKAGICLAWQRFRTLEKQFLYSCVGALRKNN
jgi:hypothetical protein